MSGNFGMFQQLENRRMFSASFEAKTGFVYVIGTPGADTIEVAGGDVMQVVQTSNGVTTTYKFDTIKVKKILVNAANGNDRVIFGKVNLPSIIDGAGGNDSLSGGIGNDYIYGGEGD